MKIKDKVKSHLSLWNNAEGFINGIIERPGDKRGDLVHVVFPETEKYHAFQQSFDSKDLILIN